MESRSTGILQPDLDEIMWWESSPDFTEPTMIKRCLALVCEQRGRVS